MQISPEASVSMKDLNAEHKPFPVDEIRCHFPVLQQFINQKPLVYLDNAATSQKPHAMIEAIVNYYQNDNANIHRGIHTLSERATQAFELTRERVRQFINAKNTHEIIFTKGTTEAINLVAQSFGRTFLKPNDEIIISTLEHHSNIVPWQLVCQQTGALLKVIPMNDAGEIKLDDFAKLISPKTKILAINHVSNALGTINPIKQMIDLAHQHSIVVLVDGAQAAPHMKIDIRALNPDFYAFSAHKMCGPTGVGILYGNEKWLDKMPPYQGGGDMIRSVTFQESTYNEFSYKFEAGTPNIADVIAFKSAIDFIDAIGLPEIEKYERQLTVYATDVLSKIPGLRLFGTAAEKTSVISFLLDDIHPHDIGTILNDEGIAVRAGHHCAMPLMDRLGIPATVRASLAFYNTKDEIISLANALLKVKEVFK